MLGGEWQRLRGGDVDGDGDDGGVQSNVHTVRHSLRLDKFYYHYDATNCKACHKQGIGSTYMLLVYILQSPIRTRKVTFPTHLVPRNK